jgi:undecaprenyl-diphosphatase
MRERYWYGPRWATAALILALASTVLGLLAARFDTFPLDESVTEWFNDLGSWYEPIGDFFNEHNDVLTFSAGGLGVVILVVQRYWAEALLFPLAGVLRPLLNIPKAMVDRPRPDDLEVRATYGDSSFPSGHVMTAMVVFGVWFLLAHYLVPPRWVIPLRVAAVVVVALHAASRMWGGVHWFSDTYGGVIWASTVLALVMALQPGIRILLRRLGLEPRVDASRHREGSGEPSPPP